MLAPPLITPPVIKTSRTGWRQNLFLAALAACGLVLGWIAARAFLSNDPTPPVSSPSTNPIRAAYFEKEIRDGVDVFYGTNHLWTAEEEAGLKASAQAAAKQFP